MSGDSYIRQITDINSALKRLNVQTTELKKKKVEATKRLYEWMIKNNVETYGGIEIKKIAPKQKIKRKPAKQKKEDAIVLFRDIGINDPEEFWDEFQKTQKTRLQTEENE